MDHTRRIIFLVLLIGWSIFRLVRYVRMANSKRPGPAVPPSMGAPVPRPAAAPIAPATVQSPIEPEGRTGTGLLVAAAILVAGNAVIWAILLGVPALDEVPVIWRLTAGVLANLFLIRAASLAARAGRRSQPGSGDDRNPIK